MGSLRTLLLAIPLTLSLWAVAAPGVRPAAADATPLTAENPAGSRASEADQRDAEAVLAELASKYRHLEGVTVSIGDTPNGEQAVAYYEDGRIVIDRDHEASIRVILVHEVWHVIDWRADGRIDWAESIPPARSDAYAL